MSEQADKSDAMRAERNRAILRRRARELARENLKDANQEFLPVIQFHLANEAYAIESSWVSEILPLTAFTPLPGAPPFLLGITSVRGAIIPIIDLKKFFALPSDGLTDLNRILVIRAAGLEFALLADTVGSLRLVPVQEFQPPLTTLTGVPCSYLTGVTGEGLVLLDIAELIADKRLIIGEEAALGDGKKQPEEETK
jgi:purine-binding chemotaxis protein CheW